MEHESFEALVLDIWQHQCGRKTKNNDILEGFGGESESQVVGESITRANESDV